MRGWNRQIWECTWEELVTSWDIYEEKGRVRKRRAWEKDGTSHGR